MDTLGSLTDKLTTVNFKMWHNQELLYKIRKMNLEDFIEEFGNEEGLKKLYEWLKRATDLNLQRNNLIDEIDETLIALILDVISEKDLNKYVQRKHKTY